MTDSIATRLANLPWPALAQGLDEDGFATTGPLLTEAETVAARGWYGEVERFRSRVVMARHGFGAGEYQYFRYPLPDMVTELRRALYAQTVVLANKWHEALRLARRFPADLASFTAECHAAGQARPTPLLLKYGAGDYNRLHQDLYGPHVYPIQMAILLDAPGDDFEGGEFALVEQRPRSQSRVEVVPLGRGEAVLFAVNWRPAYGSRGAYRLTMRHGVSRVRRGARHTLGIICHDAA
jgi:hypothetical protein